MTLATLLLLILVAGLASQWLAWRIGLPAIIVLGLSQKELAELIGLGVAIILFEGGMDLKLGEARRVGLGIGRLTILAPPLVWMLGTLSAHYVAGLSWPVAWVLGAILVVTGPTVILPLLRQARLNKESASLLKWEGIVNDPVGVLLAVLTFQYFTLAGSGWLHVITGLGAAVAAAGLVGGLGGWFIGWVYWRGLVQSGLLTVTVMGLVIGNMKLVERGPLRYFKENITVILLSILFIIIPTQLEHQHLAMLNWRMAAFVLSVLIFVRPLGIMLATLGVTMRGTDKFLLAWVAPRGIVAAATAGIFGPALVEAGYPDAQLLLPIVFLVIIVTVLVHGLTLGPLARKLGLAAKKANGLLIVGASPWTQALAQKLHELKVNVMVTDGSYHRIQPVREAGINVYHGEILSEHAENELDDQHLSFLLCATDNHYYNALVCKAQGQNFGHHRTFQLALPCEVHQEKCLTMQQRGYFAFDPPTDFHRLHTLLDNGWTIHSSRLNKDCDLDRLQERLGTLGEDWIMLGSVSDRGELHVYSTEQPFTSFAGWTLLYFAPREGPT